MLTIYEMWLIWQDGRRRQTRRGGARAEAALRLAHSITYTPCIYASAVQSCVSYALPRSLSRSLSLAAF